MRAMNPRLLIFFSVVAALASISAPRVVAEGIGEPSYSVVRAKGQLDGIPMHHINVQTLVHADVDITLDGLVQEPVWLETPAFDKMLVSVPGTGQKGDYVTENRLLATEKGLYISAVMYQPPETIVRRMTNRDEHIDRDTYGITIDSTGTGAFAYWFVIGLGDSVMDGKVLPVRRYTSDWDGPWLYKTSQFDKGWSVEAFFPWSMMNVPENEGTRRIGFALSRQISSSNQRYYWPGHAYSSAQFVTALNTMHVEGIEPRPQISVIPYVSSVVDNARGEDETNVGIDLTWKPSTKAEFTLSLNPDFGSVEADDVVLNLTAFETFFPEKRLFFLEGNEIFVTTPRANGGNPLRELTNENFATTSRRSFLSDFLPTPVSLLNTRRIGGTATQVSLNPGVTPERGETDLPTDLLGAAKMTGRVGRVRYGVLGAFEDDVQWFGRDLTGQPFDIEADGRDFAAARVSYEKSGENRFALGYLGTFVDGPVYDAKVHGVDMHYATGDGRWNADLQLVRSDVADITGNGGVFDMTFAPSSAVQHKLEFDYFDENVDINDLGFLRRNNYRGVQYVFRYAKASPDRFVKVTRGAVTVRQQYNVSEGQITDSGIYWRNTIEVPGRNSIRTALAYLPKRYEDINSRGNGAYKTDARLWWKVLWSTDASKVFSWTFGAGALQEDLGDWTQEYIMGVTARPSSQLVFKADVKYKRRDGWLLYQGANNFGAFNGIDWQPSVEVNWFMAPRHQMRFSMQWAGVRMDEQGFFAVPTGDGKLVPTATSQLDHDFTVSLFTAQLRYRWEIAPLTDLFVVYNRGNRLPFRAEDEFSDLFSDTLDDPLIDSFVVKLRYRFGN